jgi:HSP20 family protein
MKKRELAPWRWGGLRRRHRDEEPVGGFRQQMDVLHNEMDRLFEDMLSESWTGSLFPRSMRQEMLMPDIDETEDDKAFHVTVELPGMDEKDVDITLTDRRLTIRGEKKQDKKEEGKDYYRRERGYGAFQRSIELPGEVDASAIEASFRKGVLSIELPKTREAQEKIKHIEIKAA